MKFLYIFIGGGLGSMSRYAIWRIYNYFNVQFPYGTLTANIISCLVLGYFIGAQLKMGFSDNLKLLLMVGFCGGFSTFSTFSSETFLMFQEGQYFNAGIYIFASLILCWLFIFLGIKLA